MASQPEDEGGQTGTAHNSIQPQDSLQSHAEVIRKKRAESRVWVVRQGQLMIPFSPRIACHNSVQLFCIIKFTSTVAGRAAAAVIKLSP